MHDFIVRTISAIVFAAIILASLLWTPILFVLVFAFLILVMMREYFAMSIGNKHTLGQSLAKLSGVALFFISYLVCRYGISPIYLAFALLPVLVIFIVLLYDKDKASYKVYPYLLGAILYIAVPMSMSNIVAFDNGRFDGSNVLTILIILWSSDIGAYLFGMTFGQKHGHKLFPSISPKKSWEGYFGSVLTCIAAAVILSVTHYLDIPVLYAIILGILINVFGTFGDLAESQLKRNFGVKDSGNIMPGHGGMLDRFDGALLALPVAIIYLFFILTL